MRKVKGLVYLYYLVLDEENPVKIKIGISSKPKRRQSYFWTSLRKRTKIILSISFPSQKAAKLAEKLVHKAFESQCLGGEWFHLNEQIDNHMKALRI